MECLGVLILLISLSPAMGNPDTEDFDTILSYIGVGKWNIIYYVSLAYWTLNLPPHALAGAFLSPWVNHTCRPPVHALQPTTLLTNATTANHNAISGFTAVLQQHDTVCNYLKEDEVTGRLEEVPCTEWDFDNSTFSSTATEEFGLVCGKQYLRAAYQSLYMAGFLVGALISGYLAYRFGRLTIIIVSTIAYIVIAFGSAWLPSLEVLLISRFLLGVMHPTSMATSFILAMEVTQIRWRATVLNCTSSLWGIGTMWWGLIAYLERDWRLLQTYASLLAPITLPIFLLMNESPRWLVVTGRHERAVSVLQKAAKLNRTKLPPTPRLLSIMKSVQEQSSSSNVSGLREISLLFSSRSMFIITTVMSFGFLTVAMVFFGLTLAATVLEIKDPFTFMVISGLVELVKLPGIYLTDKIGRRKFGILLFGVCAISLLLQPLVHDNMKWLSVTLVMIGKMSSACAFTLMYLYCSELYPTEIRTQGLGVCLVFSRVGAFIAPFIMSALEADHPWAISVVFGSTAVVTCMAFLPLWETGNVCLPDTIAQLEEQRIKRLTRTADNHIKISFKSVPKGENLTTST